MLICTMTEKKRKNFSILIVIVISFSVLLNGIFVSAQTDTVNEETQFEYVYKRLPSLPTEEYEEVEVYSGYEKYTVPWGKSITEAEDGAPVISGWNKEVLPNETVTFTGEGFTCYEGNKSGSDVTFWIWSGKNGGMLQKMELQQVAKDLVTATIPKEMPEDMYMVWAENAKGISTPVIINRAEGQWIGPLGNTVSAGESKRVFGRNLTDTLGDRREDGEAISHVYLKSANGTIVECPINTELEDETVEVNQYAVSFTVPSTVSVGTYELYVSNGMGGEYGFGEPLELIVERAFEYGDYFETLLPSGENDSVYFKEALKRIAEQPNGGTLYLTAGTYYLDYQIFIYRNTRIVGAGMDRTVIEADTWINIGRDSNYSSGDTTEYNNIWIEGLTVQAAKNAVSGGARLRTSHNTYGGPMNKNICIKDVKFLEGGYGVQSQVVITAENVEVTDCSFEWKLVGTPVNWWVHGNDFYGVKTIGQNESNGSMEFSGNYYTGGKIGKLVLERNYACTPEWPTDSDGNRNYDEFETQEEFANRQHNTRLVHFACHSESIVNSYIARNKTDDTGICDNKGEIILFHSQEDPAFYRVSNATEDKLYINTVPAPELAIKGLDDTAAPYTQIDEKIVYQSDNASIDGSAMVVITSGKGKGQVRRVISHGTDYVTVDKPFRVIPDSTSVFHITLTYTNQVVYSNELNGLPEGFRDTGHVASVGVDFDGGAINCVADQNISRRTYYGDFIQGYVCGAQSFWTVIRDSENIDNYRVGSAIDAITNSPNHDTTLEYPKEETVAVSGTLTLGCWIRNCKTDAGIMVTVETKGITNKSTVEKIIDGCGVENTRINKKLYSGEKLGRYMLNYTDSSSNIVPAAIGVGGYTSAVIRNIVLGKDLPSATVSSGLHSYPLYDNITSEKGKVIFEGIKSDKNPLVHYRNLNFVTSAGVSPIRQMMTVSNYGETYTDWYIDRIDGDFIKTAISGNIFTPEKTSGTLTVGIDGTKLTDGIYKGVIYLASHNGGSCSIGVTCLVNDDYVSAQPDSGDPYINTVEEYRNNTVGENLILNPSFEDGEQIFGDQRRELTDWNLVGYDFDLAVVKRGETVSYVDSFAKGESYVMQIHKGEYGVSQTVTSGIIPFKKYVLQFIFFHQTANNGGVVIEITDQNGDVIHTYSQSGTTVGEVSMVDTSFYTDSDTTSLTLKITASRDYTRIDLVNLYRVPDIAVPAGTNLLANPSFEDGELISGGMRRELTGWQFVGADNDLAVVDRNTGYSEEYVAFTYEDSYVETGNETFAMQIHAGEFGIKQTVMNGVLPSKKYTLTFVFFHMTALNGGVSVQITDQNGEILLSSTRSGTDNGKVTEFEETFMTNANTAAMTLSITGTRDYTRIDLLNLELDTENLSDINGDGKTDGLDLISLRKYLLFSSGYTASHDLNYDSVVNICDLVLLKKMLSNSYY